MAQLHRIMLEPMTVQEIERIGVDILGTSLGHGSAQMIHFETAGLHALVEEYVLMAKRQGALLSDGRVVVLTRPSLNCDARAAEEVRLMAQRFDAELRDVLELLAMAGTIPVTALRHLGLLQVTQQHHLTLIETRNGKVGLRSSFYAEAIRGSFPPGKNRELFERYGELLQSGVATDPRYTLWAIAQGESVDSSRLQEAIRHSLEDNAFEEAAYLLEQADGFPSRRSQQAKIQLLFGQRRFHAAEVIAQASARGAGDDATQLADIAQAVLCWIRGEEDRGEGEPLANADAGTLRGPVGPQEMAPLPLDREAIFQIQLATENYRSGNFDRLMDLESIATNTEAQLLLPRINYRLTLLVLKIRAMIERAEFGRARKQLDDFELVNSFEVSFANGTLELLRSMLESRIGNVAQSRVHLRHAQVELQLRDPQSMLPMSAVLQYVLSGGEAPSVDNVQGHGFSGQELLDRPGFQRADTNGAGDRFGDALLRPLMAALCTGIHADGQITQLLERIPETHVIPRVNGLYYAALRSADNELRQFCADAISEIQVPPAYLTAQRMVRIVQLCGQADPEAMLDFGEELHAAGDQVLALEIMSQVVQYWSSRQDARRRGTAIRKIQSWLGEIEQEPWGVISAALKLTGLTTRENEIVELVRRGLTNREIARVLTVSQRTVEGHLYRIFAKLGVYERSELFVGD
ncbi:MULTISPECIES: helix-turn-helix transcriptional regulator [unclassified Arthrobacter]|uniref:helix-turn-helix transcriptional regulator n=1 Tax=unclassified Arthrobacter TaxID=235627 RepID=UPI0015E36DA9|nr:MULTISPECIES: helix-turn-helix transcriptional regulator [unclassified Arthrobacter]